MTYLDDDSDLLPEPGPTASDVEGLDKLKPCDPKSPLAKEIAQAFDEYYHAGQLVRKTLNLQGR